MSVYLPSSHQAVRRTSVERTPLLLPRPVPTQRLARVRYRLGQFLRGLTARVSPDEMLVAAEILPRPALARFCQMPLDAQRHSLDVLYTLWDAGYTDPDLAVAALLHDVGKLAAAQAGIRYGLWLRGPLVIASALWPDRVARWASDDPRRTWRYLLWVHQEHPRLGAIMAREDGCSELACWLIEHHQTPLAQAPRTRQEKLLSALQWADQRN